MKQQKIEDKHGNILRIRFYSDGSMQLLKTHKKYKQFDMSMYIPENQSKEFRKIMRTCKNSKANKK